HGDALHLGVFDPKRPGLQVWQTHENGKRNGGVGATFRDAKTGEIIFKYGAVYDVGRGMIAAMDPNIAGAECWASGSPLYSSTGEILPARPPRSTNFGIWWDGDDQRELLDGNRIEKFGKGIIAQLGNYESAIGCNGTKNTPNLQADILGDWREEVILHSADNSKLIIFTTTAPTSRRIYTLMHDPIYRLGIAWQNVAYNQPPDVSFYLGPGMSTPPTPKIIPWR
ncbi:MAG: dockerin, partial [Bacteroidota bacterium]|nr:dockerin [Bacteroidota bacterium]